jgi:hypothetical protein
MPYNFGPNFQNIKGTRIDPGDRLVLQMYLSDAFNVPRVIQRELPDDSLQNVDLRWDIVERRNLSRVIRFTNDTGATVIDPVRAIVELIVRPMILISGFGYRHQLAIKWPDEDEDAWDIVGSGHIIIVAQQGDRAIQSAL